MSVFNGIWYETGCSCKQCEFDRKNYPHQKYENGLIKTEQDIVMPECKPAQPEISFLKEMQVLELKPDDIIVLKSPVVLSKKQSYCLIDSIKKFIPNHKIVILEDGLEIGVIRVENYNLTVNGGQK